MVFQNFETILMIIIIITINYRSVIGTNLNYEDCGLRNVYSVSIDGCDDQRSTNDECVILNKNSLSYSITFSATISARMLYNNETFQQSKQTDIINNVGDLCKNPSKYQLDSCPIEANHILRIQKTITYMNRFSVIII
mgnify:CR=1 FL=1